MAERAQAPLPWEPEGSQRPQGPQGPRARGRLRLIVPAHESPDALDETVVHDPHGRPWLVSTIDVRHHGRDADGAGSWSTDDPAAPPARYETQVYYTARAGIRGFPTGHGERFEERADAVAGHRRWCLLVRHGGVLPDLPPEQPL
jgi:hypothetical protein